MKYVTIAQICAHAGKHSTTVIDALKRAGVKLERIPGVLGYRVLEKDANRFLAFQWPEVGPMSAAAQLTTA